MRIPRITVRRLMAAVGIAALMICGGMLTWRWQHFRSLARTEVIAAERAAKKEQRIKRMVAIYEEELTTTDRELDQMRREDGPHLTGEGHDLIEAQIKLFEWNKNRVKGLIEKSLREAKEVERLRITCEASARRYQAIASHPWAPNRHEN